MRYVIVPARVLFAFIFIASGVKHVMGEGIEPTAAAGFPMANIAVPLAGLISLVGGLSILLGYRARIGGALIVLFLVPVTLTLHEFWGIADPQLAQMQIANFMKNVALVGGALTFVALGAGPYSLDARRAARA